MTKDPF